MPERVRVYPLRDLSFTREPRQKVADINQRALGRTRGTIIECGTAVRPLRLQESAGLASRFNGILFVPLVLAVLFIAARWALLGIDDENSPIGSDRRTGTSQEVRASTLTVVGALLGTILSGRSTSGRD